MIMIDLREILKNLAYIAPTRFLEIITNYSVICSSKSSLLPKEVLAQISKDLYFEDVHHRLGFDQPLLFLEFGVYKGDSIRKWSQMNQCSNSRFFGFDSFIGLPEKWRQRPIGYFDTGGHIPDISDSRVTFVKGWFNKTLPQWLSTHREKVAASRIVVHIDSDLYSSALYVLTQLHSVFTQYYVLFDNYCAGEARALRDYIAAYGAIFRPIVGRKRKRYSWVPMQVFGVIDTQATSVETAISNDTCYGLI